MTSHHPAAAFALAALALIMSADAGAVTVASLAGAPDPGPLRSQQLVVTFHTPVAPGFTWTGGLAKTIGAATKIHTAPAQNSSRFGFASSAHADPVAYHSRRDRVPRHEPVFSVMNNRPFAETNWSMGPLCEPMKEKLKVALLLKRSHAIVVV